MVYESELYHHGILGQKWGKKNGPPYPLGSGKKKYGMSKRKVKSEIRKAKRDYRENKSSTHTYEGITGDSWKKVRDQNLNDILADKTLNQLGEKAKELIKKGRKEYGEDFDIYYDDKYEKQYGNLEKQYYNRQIEISKKYTDQYNEALLKDIGYDNLTLGKQMLNEYGIYNYNGLGLRVKMNKDDELRKLGFKK